MLALKQILPSPTLNRIETTIIQAFQGEKVVDIFKTDQSRLNKEFLVLISEISNTLNQSKTGEDKAILTQGLVLEAINYFPSITVQEVRLALNNGIRGEYGQYFGLSVATFHNFIKAFLAEEKRQIAIKKQFEYEESLKEKPITEEDKQKLDAIFWEREVQRLNDFKRTKRLEIESPIIHFKIYEDAGKIVMSTPDKWRTYQIAERSIESKLQAEIAAGGADMKDRKKMLQRIKDKELNESDKAAIKSLACFLCLEEYFEKLAK
jgi:hypothetical protein